VEKETASIMRRSTLIVSIAVIAALAAAIAALSLWPEQPPPPPPSPPHFDTGELIMEAAEDVSGILVTPLNGTPYSLVRDPSAGSVSLDAADLLFPGRQSALNLAFNSATRLTGLTRVTAEADDAQLALFGLDAPAVTWRVNRADGTSAEFMAGAEQAAGSGRYVRRQGSREVFLLTAIQSANLTRSLEELYDLSFFPYTPSDDEPVWPMIDHLLLETDGGAIELRKRTEEELTASEVGTSMYQILQPFEGESSDMAQLILLEKITFIRPVSVEEVYPSDLSAYGLDSPDRLTVSSGEWTGTILIGGRDPARGGRFIMFEGIDAVLFDPDSDTYSFLGIEPTQLRQGIIWLHNITDVSAVTFELDGVTRILTLEHDGERESLYGELDGRDIGETNSRRLYLAALRVAQSGGTPAAVPAGPPKYGIVIHFLDGGQEAVELYSLSDSEFLIVHNGVNTGLFITRMSLQRTLLSRFEMLDNGEDLPTF
jgi:hypothetical protein